MLVNVYYKDPILVKHCYISIDFLGEIDLLCIVKLKSNFFFHFFLFLNYYRLHTQTSQKKWNAKNNLELKALTCYPKDKCNAFQIY